MENIKHTRPTILIKALEILSKDVVTQDGVANAALAEAAQTMELLWNFYWEVNMLRASQKNTDQNEKSNADLSNFFEARVDAQLEKISFLWRNPK